MKVHLPVLAGPIILGMAPTVAAGSDNAKKLVGTWELTKYDGDKYKGPKVEVEFAKDGKFTITFLKDDKTAFWTVKAVYEAKDDKVTITEPGEKPVHGFTITKLTKTELHTAEIDRPYFKYELKRVKTADTGGPK